MTTSQKAYIALVKRPIEFLGALVHGSNNISWTKKFEYDKRVFVV